MRRRAAAMDGEGEGDEEHNSTAAHHREVMSALATNRNSLAVYVHVRAKWMREVVSSRHMPCAIWQDGDAFFVAIRTVGTPFNVRLDHDGITYSFHDKKNRYFKHVIVQAQKLDCLYRELHVAQRALHLLPLPTDLHAHILDYVSWPWDQGALVEPTCYE